MSRAPRTRLTRDDAEDAYVRAGELEVFRQLQRDGELLDSALLENRALAVGPFGRLRTDAVVDGLGKTRGAINHLWGSQDAFRAAIMRGFLNDATLGLDDVEYPAPASCATIDEWIGRWAAVELERGPRHGMHPENRYGLRWAAWLGLVPYGIWSDTVADASMAEYRAVADHVASNVLEPALAHFGLRLDATTLQDLAVAVSSSIEGYWLTSSLTAEHPLDPDATLQSSLTATLRLLVRGATSAA
jgi:hypothetical protein